MVKRKIKQLQANSNANIFGNPRDKDCSLIRSKSSFKPAVMSCSPSLPKLITDEDYRMAMSDMRSFWDSFSLDGSFSWLMRSKCLHA